MFRCPVKLVNPDQLTNSRKLLMPAQRRAILEHEMPSGIRRERLLRTQTLAAMANTRPASVLPALLRPLVLLPIDEGENEISI